VNNKTHYNVYALQLDHGVRDISRWNEKSLAPFPGHDIRFPRQFRGRGRGEPFAGTETISLGVFGLIAGLAALIIAAV